VFLETNRRFVWLAILLIFAFVSGCGNSETKLAATKTKIAADILGTQAAAAPTLTHLALPTATQTLNPTQKITLTSVARATTHAQSMAELIQQLNKDGFLDSTHGEFIALGNYEKYLAKLNQIKYFSPDIGPEELHNFVLRSDLAWKIASEDANLDYSGCGFWFGYDGIKNHYHTVIMNLDGNVELSRCLDCDEYLETVVRAYYGELDYMQGEAGMVLIVEGSRIQVLINGEPVILIDDQIPSKGIYGFAVASGLRTSYGTYCAFNNIEIWNLDP
jgi:hypothetical protein